MSLSFQVMPRDDAAVETAIETRQYLSDLLVRIQPLLATPALAELSKEDIRQHRAVGASKFYGHETATPGQKVNSLIQFMQYDARSTRVGSYVFEGVVKEFHRALHQAGQKLDEELRALITVRIFRDYIGGPVYTFCAERGVDGFGAPFTPWMECLSDWQLGPLVDGPYGVRSSATEQARADVQQYLNAAPVACRWWDQPGPVPLNYARPLVLCYTDTDGPWVAGFLTVADLSRARFSRVRLGTWLATLGVPDDKVKSVVEKAKASSAGAQFELHPNDIPFGDLYVRGRDNVSSCMAAPADEYETWDDIHPTDVYSSSYYGSGDNGLCLVTQVLVDEIIGRGILSAKTGHVVRWYGNVEGRRALERVGIRINGYALKGSWLSLHDMGRKFIAPYVDGDVEYGRVSHSDGRVYLGNDGVYLSETSGVVGQDEVYCEDDGEYHDRDECEYQSENNNYVSPNCDDWRCTLLCEWDSEDNRESIYLDGEKVEVCGRVLARTSQYLTEIPATEDMLEEFAEYDDNGDIINADDVPTNYTGRGAWATVPQAHPAFSFFSSEVPTVEASGGVIQPALAAEPPARTVTGRISASNPQIANLPEDARRMADWVGPDIQVVAGCNCAYCRTMRGVM